MNVRRYLDEHPRGVSAVTSAAVVIALVAIYLQLRTPGPPAPPMNSFYTVDDGATYFKESIMHVPPFDYDGKTALGAHVLIGANGKTFVYCLYRFSDKVKAKVDAELASKPTDPQTLSDLRNAADLVKRPNSPNAKWMLLGSQQAMESISLVPPAAVTMPTQQLEP